MALISMAEAYRVCVDGLDEYAKGMHSSEVVIGLSGGIDSALVACMCAEVFGPERVLAYMLPGPYSSRESLIDAQGLARNLGIRACRISIEDAYNSFVVNLAEHCPGFTRTVAAENTQARCRMVYLMGLANFHGCMMVNTGNKSEAMMGYSTLYGDTAGAYAPIGGLYKTDVFAMARWINGEALASKGEPVIPVNIITKPPSAELRPDQRDEDTLGSYAELDKLLIDHVERGLDASALVAAGYDAAEVERVTNRVAFYEFKRALEPTFPAIPYA